ncbi:adenosine kinase [Allosphingosinicella indica]|uniref:Sugar or nucleoside kinase, ribokinase family n=1 Tax=Allosphingosinicella indica TaxID=941907 RepID=A0A1X7FZ72_9SPHN|nr:adenosine kinase [Allosphingosinicella indica]SMF61392.1 Sugar or nucleoside kinase, ribokinase family [Allosphingosinicella indica]
MTAPTLDVLAIGNAIVDVIAPADDTFLADEGLAKGSMRLIDAGEAERLYGRMAAGRETSGGSAANTAAGVAALGARAGFIGQVAADQLGAVFAHDIRAVGVAFETPAAGDGPAPTARCLILVTPDAQRTMNTFLGASQHLPPAAINSAQIESAAILYLEGYLWDPEEPRAAMERAIEIARGAGRKVAFTLSDSFCIARHRAGFLKLIEDQRIDILFANEAEITELAGESDFEAAVAAIAPKVPVLVVTRSENGAIAVSGNERAEVAAEPVEKVIDTTGAGDLFAAGFLTGHAQGRSLEESLTLGAIAAAEVISHYGARPEADLKALAAKRIG